jgi:hypothetical protein
MTTMDLVSKKCAICGHDGTYTVIMSTSSFGAPDLDLRPPEIARSNLHYQIQRCPSCGYCAPDISTAEVVASKVIQREPYRHQLEAPELPELANSFLCSAMVHDAADDRLAAGLATLRAAWICDDHEMNDQAAGIRKRAAEHLWQVHAAGQEFAGGGGGEEAMLTDVMRRAGQFESARQVCGSGLEKTPEDVIDSVLRYQLLLIERKDLGRYTIEDAMQ